MLLTIDFKESPWFKDSTFTTMADDDYKSNHSYNFNRFDMDILKYNIILGDYFSDTYTYPHVSTALVYLREMFNLTGTKVFGKKSSNYNVDFIFLIEDEIYKVEVVFDLKLNSSSYLITISKYLKAPYDDDEFELVYTTKDSNLKYDDKLDRNNVYVRLVANYLNNTLVITDNKDRQKLSNIKDSTLYISTFDDRLHPRKAEDLLVSLWENNNQIIVELTHTDLLDPTQSFFKPTLDQIHITDVDNKRIFSISDFDWRGIDVHKNFDVGFHYRDGRFGGAPSDLINFYRLM